MRALVAVLILGLAAGARGGSSATPQTHPVAPQSARVTFATHWNSASTSSVRRPPKYISPSALSVSVNVNQGVPQVFNFPGTALTINAPVGTDLFAFQTYDEAYGQGTFSAVPPSVSTKLVVSRSTAG